MNRKLLSALLLIVVSLAPIAAVSAQEEAGLLIWADDTRAPIMEVLGTKFTEEYGIPVTVQELGFGDIRDNIQVAGPAGEGADIFIGAHDWLGELYANGALAPIDLGDKAELFSLAALQAFTIDGVLYGMPYAVENIAFFRNPELVPEAPATWAEVAEIAARLKAENEALLYPYVIQTNDPYHFMGVMSAFGGYVFGLDEAGNYNPDDIGVGNEGAIAAARFLDQLVKDGLLGPDVDYDVMHTLFETGQAAMLMTGPWALPRIRESGVPYAISNIPSGTQEASPFLGVQGFMISAFSQNQLLAQIFLTEFVATEETMQAIFEADPRPPAFLPVLEKVEDPDMAAFGQAGLNGQPMPAIPEMASVWSSWGNAQALVIQQQQTPEEAFTTAAEQIRSLIAEARELAATGRIVVGIPGSYQAAVGCPGDWQPECELTLMTLNEETGLYELTLTIPAGAYEFKIALNKSWEENYGADGVRDGANLTLALDAESTVTFTWDLETKVATATIGQ